ncbi:hypothetical protein D3C72_2350680 [compost metagenome]
MLRNAFAQQYLNAERSGSDEELDALFAQSTLKQAALEGNVELGKVEAGQSAGLIDDLVPAGELMQRLVEETLAAIRRLSALG